MALFGLIKNSERKEPLLESIVPNSGNPAITGQIGLAEGNFIGDSFYDTGGVFGLRYQNEGVREVERAYILQQRNLAMYPEVAIAIEEIMRELYILDDKMSLTTDADDEVKPATLKKLNELFAKFKVSPFTMLNARGTPQDLLFFNYLKQVYIDGQFVVFKAFIPKESKPVKNNSMVHGYDFKKIFDVQNLNENDLKALLEAKDKKVSPKTHDLVFIPLDPAKFIFKNDAIYYENPFGGQTKLDRENVIQGDFGLFDVVGSRHGFLQYAFKYANQLTGLQDMLLPQRFKRSVSRRVFNVDVGNLPQQRAKAYMQDLSQRMKYKRRYDATTGKIVAERETEHGLTEDYWFSSNAGSKGTSVDLLDERGAFTDDLEDVKYFNKKLYQALFIPLRRVFESDADTDYTQNNIELDELRFHNFLKRLRFVFNELLTRMFEQYVEFHDPTLTNFSNDLANVKLNYDNWFEQNKRREQFTDGLNNYRDAKEQMGKTFSAETIFRTLFDMTPEDVQDEIERIKSEVQPGSIYSTIYMTKEDM